MGCRIRINCSLVLSEVLLSNCSLYHCITISQISNTFKYKIEHQNPNSHPIAVYNLNKRPWPIDSSAWCSWYEIYPAIYAARYHLTELTSQTFIWKLDVQLARKSICYFVILLDCWFLCPLYFLVWSCSKNAKLPKSG